MTSVSGDEEEYVPDSNPDTDSDSSTDLSPRKRQFLDSLLNPGSDMPNECDTTTPGLDTHVTSEFSVEEEPCPEFTVEEEPCPELTVEEEPCSRSTESFIDSDKTLQLAKISKVLLALEKGRLAEFHGKNLDEITIDPNENVMGSDEEDACRQDGNRSFAVDEPSADETVAGTVGNEISSTGKQHKQPSAEHGASSGVSTVGHSPKEPSTEETVSGTVGNEISSTSKQHKRHQQSMEHLLESVLWDIPPKVKLHRKEHPGSRQRLGQ
ncbi:uncharacterized protein LOC125887856 [Epinephelus fuscoguttatus]|uniref:uncharacterized protein LOC125887856 n=1 Tax=Epinephelus fuscoguttatus TaxID=293821 RepID=UPI0020D0CE0B|nr:uncharacterized protein LOC125887856 [Epinephelus fuscoguttatus]